MELRHLRKFLVPVGVLGLDGDNTALHVVNIILILLEGH